MSFYNYPVHPTGNILRHVGIVLCVENGYVFTIEGNSVTNRLDYPFYGVISKLTNSALQPKDYVSVKCYPLDEHRIRPPAPQTARGPGEGRRSPDQTAPDC